MITDSHQLDQRTWTMKVSDIKRHAFRTMLAFHFLGLALTIGIRIATLTIDRVTGGGDLQTMSFGRDMMGVLARSLTLPGFVLTVVTGVSMVLLRYGSRPPIWVCIKVGLTTAALLFATPFVRPALEAARYWAQWSVEHGRLAPELHDSISRANFYGAIVFALFVLNIPVAIWKPFSSLPLSRLLQRKNRPSSTQQGRAGSVSAGRDVATEQVNPPVARSRIGEPFPHRFRARSDNQLSN
jgi:hypothetical protein